MFIWLSAATILIFRSELAIICGLMLMVSLIKKRISLLSVIFNGLFSLVIFIGLSFMIDSYFWKYNVWPEGIKLKK